MIYNNNKKYSIDVLIYIISTFREFLTYKIQLFDQIFLEEMLNKYICINYYYYYIVIAKYDILPSPLIPLDIHEKNNIPISVLASLTDRL